MHEELWMKKELYDQLTAKEKLMYDELSGFSNRLATRFDEVVMLLKALIEKVNLDP